MRLSSFFVVLIAFVVAGFASVFAARATVAVVEGRSVVAVQESLLDQRHDWVRVQGDGLQVILEGEAPSEAVRFRAMSIAGGIVDASRVIDNMSVMDTAGIAPPDFAIEILRNDSGVSLIGLIPTATDRDEILAEVGRIAGSLPVTDLLQEADYPVPDGWRRALTYALRALAQLPRAKISVAADAVSIDAISDSVEQKRRLETDLARTAPAGMRLALSISAPRPVITPFTVRFVRGADGARFDACAADTEEAQRKIIAAAVAAGVSGQVACPLGLGVPSRSWGDAVARGIAALDALGGGTLTFADTDVVLVATEATTQADFDRVVGELANALPDVYALESELPRPAEVTADGPPQFTVTLSPEGQVQLRGWVPDELINTTARNFAMARFGRHEVTMGTRISEGLPPGWAVRVLAGIEALSMLSNGSVVVQPDLMTVRGNTGDPEANALITRLMIDKLGQNADLAIDVTYVEALDPVAGLPTAEECVAEILAVTEARKITFDPGSATITAVAQPVIDDIADILRRCAELRLQIAGYTDSQGRDEMNLALSQQRADAVLDALRARRVPVASFSAIGYGEADPIADNETEGGREANRRIAFSLIVPEPVAEEPTTLEEIEAAAEAQAAAVADGAGDPDAAQTEAGAEGAATAQE
ncbi:MAG: OmpA family protein [Rhodobacterales bacterium]|nr:OmpA family protein [Rhodobacterales bacterium]